MSTHKVECVPVTLEKHPAADALSVVRVFGGYTVCVRTIDWEGRNKGLYIEPDYVVPLDRLEFAFLQKPGELKQTTRVKVKKLRGVVSYGLLIPAPEGASIGEDFMERLGVTRYEPPENVAAGGEGCPGPTVVAPKYDLENWRRYSHLLRDGELIEITEKLHGASGRYCFHAGKMFCGSRTEWKAESDSNQWWQALRANPWIESFCRAYPDVVVYGEVFGQVGGFPYGQKGLKFRVFDCLRDGKWAYIPSMLLEHRVPLLYYGPYSTAIVEALTDGPSMIPGAQHIREGCVIKPVVERVSEEIGRVALKSVSAAYFGGS